MDYNTTFKNSFIVIGELKADSGLGILAKQFEINVDEVGVKGAKTFFEAKVRSSNI